MSHHEHPKHVTPDEHDAPDAWHSHTPDEKPQPTHGEVANARLILGVGGIMFFFLIVTVAIVYGYYIWYTTRLLNEQESFGLESSYLEYRNTTRESFKGYTWVPEAAPVTPKDTVQTPLDVAMKKTAARYAARKN